MPFNCSTWTFDLPNPTGPYDVGITEVMWGNRDGCLFDIFYPTLPSHKLDEYNYKSWLPEPQKEYFESIAKAPLELKTNAVEEWISSMIFDRMRAKVYADAPLASNDDYSTSSQFNLNSMPVLVCSHGLGCHRAMLSNLCSEFASYGYVVASLDHRDGSACYTYYINEKGKRVDVPFKFLKTNGDYEDRNRQVNQRASECSMVVDFLNKLQNGEPVKNLSKTNFDLGQFENRLIMSSVGIFGHSFGGATTATVLVKDHRFSCGIALDPWMFPVDHDLHHNFNKPFYVLNAHSFSWPHNITQIQRFMDKDNTENADRKLFTIRETCHIDLTDFPLLLPYFLANQTIKVGNLDPSLKGAVSNKICFDFFEKYLCCTECNRYRGGNINVLDYAFEGTNVEVAGHENDGKELDVLKLIFW